MDYDDEEAPAGMTETEKQIWMAKKKHRQEEEEHMREYIEERARERERLETELEELRERQARRREEREEEMAKMQEMQRTQEEQRKQDDEERRAKLEAEKRRKEGERKKKQAMMAGGGLGGLVSSGQPGKPNFVLPQKEKEDPDKPQMKIEAGHTKEEAMAAKEAYLARYKQPFECDDDASSIRARIKGMHDEMCKLEALKYDLEQRSKIQDYDLRELRERAKQQARQKALKKGLDPDEYANAKHPPKKAVASKYDRQIDRRSFSDRRTMYAEQLRMDGKPQLPPPKAIFHGSCRPPETFGRPATKLEELEQLRKNMEGVKYQEVAPVEGAKPPVKAVPAGPVPADDEIDTTRKPAAAAPPPPAPAAADPPAVEEPAAEEEEEE